MVRNLLFVILALSVFGFVLSGYSFAHHESFVSGALCNLDAEFNCDIVNRGPYSELFGVPISLIGLVGYGFLFAAAAVCLKRPDETEARTFLALAAFGGLGFSLYLTSIEAFVLETWCIVCLMSQVTILGIFAASLYVRLRAAKATV